MYPLLPEGGARVSEFTPIATSDPTRHYIIDDRAEIVAGDMTPEVATLFAAAPELLKGCEAANHLLWAVRTAGEAVTVELLDEVLAFLQAAITKAQGGAA